MSVKQGRKWFCRVTMVNNTLNGEYVYNFDELYDTLCEKYDNVLMALHDKDKDNIHCHIIIQNDTGIKFQTLKNLIPYGDIEKQHGKNLDCYNYCLHIDEKSKLSEKIIYDDSCIRTNIQDLETWKLLSNESGSRSDLTIIYNMLKNGVPDTAIADIYPSQFLMYNKQIFQTRQLLLQEQYGNDFRQLDITYIYGSTGVGKTRYVMEKYGYKNVYRVTNYGTGCFDGYNGQDVILFDEFRSSIKIADMLTYMDGYPVSLPCRFYNKPALFTKVFIVSNIPLYDQYKNIQQNEFVTFRAFCRRINRV